MSDYEVGYGRPPQHTRFRKGQSGNPRGRPKNSKSLVSIARRVLNEKIIIKENGRRRTITKFEAAIKQLVNKAASGDGAALRELLKVAMVATSGPAIPTTIQLVPVLSREIKD